MTTEEFRDLARREAPNLWSAVGNLSAKWSACIVDSLNSSNDKIGSPKTFADPVLGPIDLFEWEVILLDSPFLQRLRGIRQLGMVHAVYPGAVHDRFTHSIGVVEIADRMVEALTRNANHRRTYGDKDSNLPVPDAQDRFIIRLAALLHDIGHGPFSHASEDLVSERHEEEFIKLNSLFREKFEGATGVKPSEAFAILLVISEPLKKVFEHPRFVIPVANKSQLPTSIVALILGSRGGSLKAPYLYELISGPIDADKLDYMARDSYFTGLPVGIDVTRLIKKLEIVRITPENAINDELRRRAESASEKAVYELGVSLSGLTAYEQMIVGRALLYDRVYYHHKVRCGEAMLRKLFRLAESEAGNAFSVEDLYTDISDDSMIHLLGGNLIFGNFKGGGVKSSKTCVTNPQQNTFSPGICLCSPFFRRT